MRPGNLAAEAYSVIPIRQLDLAYEPRPWPFADERRAEIDAYFEGMRRERPALWNGPVLLLHRHRVSGDLLEGAFLRTGFASFMAWRDWGFPDAGVLNCFSMGALRASDGAWLLGVGAAHTATAGRIYFPAGTPDADDVFDGKVDLAGSVTREVAEETGLVPSDYVAEDGWRCVTGGRRIALMKVLHAQEAAEPLRRRVLAHLAREKTPELADIRIVRGRGDYDAMMPPFMTAFLDDAWS